MVKILRSLNSQFFMRSGVMDMNGPSSRSTTVKYDGALPSFLTVTVTLHLFLGGFISFRLNQGLGASILRNGVATSPQVFGGALTFLA